MDQLHFTNTGNISLANVTFYSDAGVTAIGTGGGGLVGNELVPVPEPKAVVGGILLVALTCWRERKRRMLLAR